MTMEEGIIVPLDQPRTRAKARERIIELMSDRKVSELYVLYSPPVDAVGFRDELISQLPEPAPQVVTEQSSDRSSARTPGPARTAVCSSGNSR